jgi:hypothetical protein
MGATCSTDTLEWDINTQPESENLTERDNYGDIGVERSKV